jgi:hypothetical protein
MECSFNLRNGSQCRKRAKHDYDGNLLCGTHLNLVKATDDCSICYHRMDKKPERIKLKCGHYFHKACLASWEKKDCPLCKRPYHIDDLVNISLDKIVKPFILEITSLPMQEQTLIINIIALILKIYKKSSWLGSCVHFVCSRLEQTNVSYDLLHKVLHLFDIALKYSENHGNFLGFNANI